MNTGKDGEKLAAEYLKKKGYKIIDTNYRVIGGEIDIIAYGKGFTVFAEVKTRSSLFSGRPAEAVTGSKIGFIKKTAGIYMGKEKIKGQPRFDIIEVLLNKSGDVEEINHIENAF